MFYYKKVTKAIIVLLFVFILSILLCKAVTGNIGAAFRRVNFYNADYNGAGL